MATTKNKPQTSSAYHNPQSAATSAEKEANLLAIENTAEVLALIDQMVISLIKEPENKAEILELFCQTCTTIREKGLMCPKCQKEMPQEWAEKCFFCREYG